MQTTGPLDLARVDPRKRISRLVDLGQETWKGDFFPNTLFAMDVYHESHALEQDWYAAVSEELMRSKLPPSKRDPTHHGQVKVEKSNFGFWPCIAQIVATAEIAARQNADWKWRNKMVEHLKELIAKRLEEAQVEVEWVAVLLDQVDKKGPAILRQPKVRFEENPKTAKSEKGKSKAKSVEQRPTSSKSAKDKARQTAPSKTSTAQPAPAQPEPESPGMRAERPVTAENRAEKRLVSAMKQRDTNNESPIWFAQFSEGLSYKIIPKSAESTANRPDSRSPEEAAVETKVLTAEYIRSALERSASPGPPLSPGAERKAKLVQLPRIAAPALAEQSAMLFNANRPTGYEKMMSEWHREKGGVVIPSLGELHMGPKGPKQREPVMTPVTEVTESSSEDQKGEEGRERRRR